jgi:hypothetical protein
LIKHHSIIIFLPFKYLIFLAWLRLALEADDALGEDDIDFNMLAVFENHIEVRKDLQNSDLKIINEYYLECRQLAADFRR